jgi:DNA-binding MarR family transcriptional regulator
MDALFSTSPIRHRPPRGEPLRAILGRGWHEPWPPPDRDADDIAVRATRLLATAGRMETRLRRLARLHGVDRRVLRFLLLFAERKAPLRITDVADNLGVSLQTASRIVTRVIEAGLADLLNDNCIDRREVAVRLTVAGRNATIRCLEALRADAVEIASELAPARAGWSGAYGVRWYLQNAGPMDDGWVRYDPE